MDRYGLVRLADASPFLIFDMRYATERNFLGTRLYDSPEAWLLASAAAKLAAAAERAASLGFRLVVLDAYRPLSAQARMWALKPDPAFVAPAERGSNHNRGAAVDVTLALPDSRELPMPSGFDEFSERASHRYEGGDAATRANRDALRAIMEASGFHSYEAEWWHYNDPDSLGAPLLDERLEAPVLDA